VANTEKDLAQIAAEKRRNMRSESEDDYPILMVERIFQLWWHWADFELYVVSPSFDVIFPPNIIKPEILSGKGKKAIYEHVYDIHDFGYKFSTSKAEDMYSAGMSMWKLYNTIEKIIYLLIERIKEGGISEETEVQVAFGGHLLAQRKGFESIINLSYNVIVTNFDPGSWGKRYLANVKRLADKGYGYPKGAPREGFKYPSGHSPAPS
jgi:hypothetical protein